MNYRICIFGNSGSGKSTLAKALGQKLNLPIYHLDKELLTGNYKKRPTAELSQIHANIINKPAWVIDGNFRKGLLQDRIDKADLVVFIEINRLKALFRTIRRSKTTGQDSDTVPKGASLNQISWQLIQYILTYNQDKKIRELEQICHKKNTQFMVLKSKPVDKMVIEIVAKSQNL